MTLLETWCFACITCTFGALLSYVIILVKIELFKLRKISAKDTSDDDNKNGRDVSIEVFFFSLVFAGFALFNLYFWTCLK